MNTEQAIELLNPNNWELYEGQEDFRSALQMAVAALECQRWIPCSERLPEVETEVLALCDRNGFRFVCPAIYEDGKMSQENSIWNWNELWVYGEYDEENDCYFVPEGWWENRYFIPDDVYNNAIDCPVTHWMPIPEPPEEELP